MPISAIITADIVNWTTLSPVNEKEMMLLLIAELKGYKHEFYRGDSFQAYIKDPASALKVALKARCVAKSFSLEHDIRVSIGVGEVKTPVRLLRTATGEAFILSGRAFDELAEGARMKIACPNEKANTALKVIAYFCDYIFKQLTPKQAAVIKQLLSGSTQIKAAEELDITQATVNKHAQSAGWAEIQGLLNEYEAVLTQFNLL
jgi:hypothetical protein